MIYRDSMVEEMIEKIPELEKRIDKMEMHRNRILGILESLTDNIIIIERKLKEVTKIAELHKRV